MNTIEMKVGGKTVQFTTKSLIIDGTEFYYSKMSDIKHSASKHVYAFKYDGKVEYLPYDPKFEKGLKVIFGKIHALNKKAAVAGSAPEAKAAGSAEPAESNAEKAPEPEKPSETASDTVSEEDQSAEESTAISKAPSKAPEDETVFDVPADAASEAKPEDSPENAGEDAADAAQSTDETEPESGDSFAGEKLTAEQSPETDDDNKIEEAEPPIPPEEKKGKLKKSIIILICLLVVFAIIAAICVKEFGTSSNPTSGPNSTESQQYDDIDELIEDLDN